MASREVFVDLTAGTFGGCFGTLVGQPLDTIKVRLQAEAALPQSGSRQLYNGTFDCISKTFRNEGILGFYRGMATPLAGAGVLNAVLFCSYGLSNRILGEDRKQGYFGVFVSGSIAGFFTGAVSAPIELIKCRLQVMHDSNQMGRVRRAVRQLLQTEGIVGLTRGLGTTLIRDTPSYGVYFLAYEYIVNLFPKVPAGKRSSTEPLDPVDHEEHSAPAMLIAGGFAGCISWASIYPVDVMKSRMQVSTSNAGFLECWRQAFAEGGIKLLYRGLGASMVRAFPLNAATFYGYNMAYRALMTASESATAYATD
eukprot:Clim_evm28s22 gene=Clim_evmTU28s22